MSWLTKTVRCLHSIFFLVDILLSSLPSLSSPLFPLLTHSLFPSITTSHPLFSFCPSPLSSLFSSLTLSFSPFISFSPSHAFPPCRCSFHAYSISHSQHILSHSQQIFNLTLPTHPDSHIHSDNTSLLTLTTHPDSHTHPHSISPPHLSCNAMEYYHEKSSVSIIRPR